MSIHLFLDASLYKSIRANLQAINCQEVFSTLIKSTADFINILVISEVFIHSTKYFFKLSEISSNLHLRANL